MNNTIFTILGALIVLLTYFSQYRSLLKIDSGAVKSWAKALAYVTIYRIVIFCFINDMSEATMNPMVMSISLLSLIFVGREDAVFSLPLAIFDRMIGTKWLLRPIYWFLMAYSSYIFGMGHVYQGAFVGYLMMLYVPITSYIGNRKGWGTLFINHALYDISTLVFLKALAGLF